MDENSFKLAVLIIPKKTVNPYAESAAAANGVQDPNVGSEGKILAQDSNRLYATQGRASQGSLTMQREETLPAADLQARTTTLCHWPAGMTRNQVVRTNVIQRTIAESAGPKVPMVRSEEPSVFPSAAACALACWMADTDRTAACAVPNAPQQTKSIHPPSEPSVDSLKTAEQRQIQCAITAHDRLNSD